MSNKKAQNLANLRSKCRLFVPFNQRHIILYELCLKQIISYFRILNNSLKIAQHVKLIITLHSLKDFIQVRLHLAVDDAVGQYLRLDVGKAELFGIEGG